MSRLLILICAIAIAPVLGCKGMDPAFKGGVNDKFVYVIGETKLGDIRVAYEPGMTLLDIIAPRGGITTRGISGSVRVYRPSEGKTLSCKVNYDKAAKGDFSNNIVLQGGDIVFVPKTVTAAMYDGFKAIFPPWDDMMGTGTRLIEVYQTDKATK